jgi:hypothetical protein
VNSAAEQAKLSTSSFNATCRKRQQGCAPIYFFFFFFVISFSNQNNRNIMNVMSVRGNARVPGERRGGLQSASQEDGGNDCSLPKASPRNFRIVPPSHAESDALFSHLVSSFQARSQPSNMPGVSLPCKESEKHATTTAIRPHLVSSESRSTTRRMRCTSNMRSLPMEGVHIRTLDNLGELDWSQGE